MRGLLNRACSQTEPTHLLSTTLFALHTSDGHILFHVHLSFSQCYQHATYIYIYIYIQISTHDIYIYIYIFIHNYYTYLYHYYYYKSQTIYFNNLFYPPHVKRTNILSTHIQTTIFSYQYSRYEHILYVVSSQEYIVVVFVTGIDTTLHYCSSICYWYTAYVHYTYLYKYFTIHI